MKVTGNCGYVNIFINVIEVAWRKCNIIEVARWNCTDEAWRILETTLVEKFYVFFKLAMFRMFLKPTTIRLLPWGKPLEIWYYHRASKTILVNLLHGANACDFLVNYPWSTVGLYVFFTVQFKRQWNILSPIRCTFPSSRLSNSSPLSTHLSPVPQLFTAVHVNRIRPLVIKKAWLIFLGKQNV